MREQRTDAKTATQDVAPPAVDAGEEQKTQFHAEGTIPPVGTTEAPEQAAAPSASDLAFGDVGGGGRAAVGASGAGGGGQPLPDDLRAKFETSFGTDLSGVRVHTDKQAETQTKSAGAKAFATGQDIHMAAGEYDPSSEQGQQLIAHEVAHVVQQKNTAPQLQMKSEMPAASSAPEVEADVAGNAAVAGKPANVTPVAEQKAHAKDYSRQELLNAYSSSLAKQDWADTATRLNGFSDDDIAMLVGKMTAGQHAHVREAAETAMPGYSQRVTAAIDGADSNASKIASAYTAYEKAVTAAKASGTWTEVIDRLNGMGDWDIQDRLKKLTWFDYEAMRGQTTNARVLAAIDKADTARVTRSQAAYDQAIASQDWPRAAAQLHGMNDEGMAAALDALASKKETIIFLKRIKEAAPHDKRLVDTIDRVAKDHGEVVPDPLVLTPICELPDLSDELRPLAGTELTNFASNPKIAKFASDLEAVFNAHRAASGRTDHSQTQDQLVDHFQTSFQTTGAHYATNITPKGKLATFAKQWMSEMRERADLESGAKLANAQLPTGVGAMKFSESDLQRIDGKHSGLKDNKPNDGEVVSSKDGHVIINGQRVHPFVNAFMDNLNSGFTASTYPKHGGTVDIAPFCLDVMPQIALDERGFYKPDQMLEFIDRINAAAGPGNWSGVYNDTTVLRELPNRGLAGKVDTRAQDGTHNFHGALNLHIHLYLRPPDGWQPPPALPDPSQAPKVDPATEQH